MKFTAEQKRAMRVNPSEFAQSVTRKQLGEILKELDNRYYVKNEPAIPDESYDILYDYYHNGKVSKKVGVRSRDNVPLPVPMSSLAKFMTLPESTRNAFLARRGGFVVSDKEDGISLEVVYQNGTPVKAFTRGDFTTGQDVSHVIPVLRIPKRIALRSELVVRGEFTAEKEVFQKHFAKDFATSRNLGGGLLNRNTADKAIGKYAVIFYEVTKGGSVAGGPLSQQLRFLEKYGFDVVPYTVYKKLDQEKLTQIHNDRRKYATRDVDGIVVTHDTNYSVSEARPKHAYAFKINSRESSVLVKVLDVVWEESRLGKMVPRVMIEPTVIGGVKVEYFTGHNAFYIMNGFGKDQAKNPPYSPRPLGPGAVIRAVRSGDVIPYIMEVVKPAKKAKMPEHDYVLKGVYAYAVHEEKSDTKRMKELVHFFASMGVDGIKEGTVKALIANGHTTIKSILNLTYNEALGLPGFADRSAKQLLGAIKKAKAEMSFVKVAVGSGVFGDGIGEKRLQQLVESYPDIMSMVKLPRAELYEKVSQVRGFKKLADAIATNLVKFHRFCRRNGIELVVEKKTAVTGNRMAGQAVLFTSVRDNQLQEWIVTQGGKIASTVKSATMLVVKDENASNNKTAEAEQLGKPVVTLAQFRKKYGIK